MCHSMFSQQIILDIKFFDSEGYLVPFNTAKDERVLANKMQKYLTFLVRINL